LLVVSVRDMAKIVALSGFVRAPAFWTPDGAQRVVLRLHRATIDWKHRMDPDQPGELPWPRRQG